MEYCVLKFYFVLEERCPADLPHTAFQPKDGCKSSKIIAVPVMEGGIIWWQAFLHNCVLLNPFFVVPDLSCSQVFYGTHICEVLSAVFMHLPCIFIFL
jgi:hypothetical protein